MNSPTMAANRKHEDEWFVKFLNERFERLHERLDAMEENRQKRDKDVNLMDTINKGETLAVKDQVIKLGDRVQRLEWLLQAAVWTVVTLGGVISWVMGLWGNVASALSALKA